MTHRKQKKRRQSDISLRERQEAPRKHRQTSRKYTVTNAEPLTGHDSPNARLGERIAQNAKRLAFLRNVAEQTKA